MRRPNRFYWLALAAMSAVYLTMLAWSLPHLSRLAGGTAMFDMRPGGYDLTTAQAILAALGEGGRAFYLTVQQRLDTAFPLLEAVVLLLSYLWLFPRPLAWVFAVPAVAGAGFDLLENAAVAAMLRAGPETVSLAMVETASRWTVLKSVFVTLALLALLAGFARLGWRHLRAVNLPR